MIFMALVAICIPGAAFAGFPKPSLVILAQSRGPNADENGVLARLISTITKRSNLKSYASIETLIDDGATGDEFFQVIKQLILTGRDIDVMVVAPIHGDTIDLADSPVRSEKILETLSPLKKVGDHGLRFVFLSGGNEKLLSAWRGAGAQSVVGMSGEGELAPFFYSEFLKNWSSGYSVSQSVALASAFSTQVARTLSRFVDEYGLRDAKTTFSPEPIFDGADINVNGEKNFESSKLNPVEWPNSVSRDRPVYNHTNLEKGLLEVLSRLVSPRVELKPEFMAGLPTLVGELGPLTFSAIQEFFPGNDAGQLSVPGADVRDILAKVIPDFDRYLQELVEDIDKIVLTQKKGRLVADLWLIPSEATFELIEKKKAKTGELYSVSLARNVHVEMLMRKDSITLEKISGITARVKLPVVPHGIYPLKVRLDTQDETLTIHAGVIGGLFEVIGKADVRTRKFSGVDWIGTILKNAPLLFKLIFFWRH